MTGNDKESPQAAPGETPVVFIVDDDISVLESLELLVHSLGWRPEIYGSARAFLASPRADAANCLILDLNLPDLSGLGLQKLLGAERADMPVIFITGCGDVPIAVEAMKAGAMEFLTKPFKDDVLIDAVEKALDRSRSARMFDAELHGLQNRYASLRRREQEVMALVASGLLNKQIAYELGISEVTVKVHRGRMMRKMRARALADLVNMAVRLGIGR